MREHLCDRGEPILLFDGHADAGVEPAGVLVKRLKVLGCVELSVWVLELGHESTRRLFVQRANGHRVNEPIVDYGYDLLEQPDAVLRLTLLHDEPAHDDRGNDDSGEQGFSGARRGHGSIREKDCVERLQRRIRLEYV